MNMKTKRWSVPNIWPIQIVKKENGYELYIIYGSIHIPLDQKTGEQIEKEVKEFWRKKSGDSEQEDMNGDDGTREDKRSAS